MNEGENSRVDFIKVMGHTYAFEYKDLRHEGTLGNSCGMKGYIRIDTCQTESQQKETLLHEIFHQISYTLHLDLKEETVQRLAAGIQALIVDNPEMFTMTLPGRTDKDA